MQKALAGLLALSIGASCLIGCSAPLTSRAVLDTNQQTEEFRPDGVSRRSLIVIFKKAPSKDFAQRHGLQIKRSLLQINSLIVSVPSGDTPEKLRVTLAKDPQVAKVELDRALDNDEDKTNDPRRQYQYSLDAVKAESAWSKTMGEGIKIAIVDTGVDLSHPDLVEKLLPGINIIDQSLPPQDEMGHGTHVAGIAAAATNNHTGIAGMAPKAMIIPVKVLDKNGDGSTSNVAAGILWAADHGADVINVSAGDYEDLDLLERAVSYAINVKNAVVVATMGNDNVNRKRYPAACAGVIAVGSIDFFEEKAGSSNFGDWISVCAPGDKIVSTFPNYPVTASATSRGYATLSGTSMACPLVSGLVALIRSQKKGATPAQVKAILERSATDLGAPGFDKNFGHGCINAEKALQ